MTGVGAVVPSLFVAPIATRVPSEDIDTECPKSSPAASPSMSAANLGPSPTALRVHAHVAGVGAVAVVVGSADRHPRAVRGHIY